MWSRSLSTASNYRELLQKCMALIVYHEGMDYIFYAEKWTTDKAGDFSRAEVEELRLIAKGISGHEVQTYTAM